MNKIRISIWFFISVSMLGALYFFVSIPTVKALEEDDAIDNYGTSQLLYNKGTHKYNVDDFGDPTWWYVFTDEGYWETSPGGLIKINLTGYGARHPYDWGDAFPSQIPYFNLEIYNKTNSGLQLNKSLDDRSNKEVAYAMVLGFNDFQSGFMIPNYDFYDLIQRARLEATNPDGSWDITGDITATTSYRKIIYIHFIQTDGTGDQNTLLIYDKSSGLLVYAKTSYGNYKLEISLDGYEIDYSKSEASSSSSRKSKSIKEDENLPDFFYPVLIIASVVAVTLISITVIAKKKMKRE